VVETFRQHNLEMPYPQHDIHLRSGPWRQVLPPPASEPDPGGHGNRHGQDPNVPLAGEIKRTDTPVR
jgi:hypothetical protein